MKAEILCVGTELLLGDVVNSNAAYISRELAILGIGLYYHHVVGDNSKRLEETLALCFSRSDIVILTGGLGPTYDDLTKETVAKYFGLEMEMDKTSLESIKSIINRLGREMTTNNEKQALIPKGAKVLTNDNGTAPGIAINEKGKIAILLPGPPREMIPMFENHVVPYLQQLCGGVFISKKVNIFGIGESVVEDMLLDLMKNASNPTLAPYVSEGELYIRITANAKNEEEANALIAPACKEVSKRLGKYIYAYDSKNMQCELVSQLTKQGKTLATAESCTGGLLSKKLTEVSGSSKVFHLGVCTYSDEMKEKVLGVKSETLKKYGAVSANTAKEMAVGVINLSGADIGVSITGIAGPTGATETKKVGLVYLGIATKEGVSSVELDLSARRGDRENIRIFASVYAMYNVLCELSK